ncbi:hypothetical protein EDEG_01949 [Edhazardia aedis USNM 41457]|uniref:Uncharacterized protein n=1 Tax=Edhazardia aedis (strain USNM 41457) TaxID=1003232 RepID=J9D8B3_EDHAE|nr:hypothetical protein EDEG_01949 [Edhazardia aedis USNM 41457]|eukprot:EJW03754.1 hypothetical protein EDEG_01949 [Edhazardia aedis USNM 41457]
MRLLFFYYSEDMLPSKQNHLSSNECMKIWLQFYLEIELNNLFQTLKKIQELMKSRKISATAMKEFDQQNNFSLGTFGTNLSNFDAPVYHNKFHRVNNNTIVNIAKRKNNVTLCQSILNKIFAFFNIHKEKTPIKTVCLSSYSLDSENDSYNSNESVSLYLNENGKFMTENKKISNKLSDKKCIKNFFSTSKFLNKINFVNKMKNVCNFFYNLAVAEESELSSLLNAFTLNVNHLIDFVWFIEEYHKQTGFNSDILFVNQPYLKNRIREIHNLSAGLSQCYTLDLNLKFFKYLIKFL